MTPTNSYIFLRIPKAYSTVYEELLTVITSLGKEIIKDCNCSNSPNNRKYVDCWITFQSACAAYDNGDIRQANLFIKYIVNELGLGADIIDNLPNKYPSILNISVKHPTTAYTVGDTVVYDGAVIATYDDGTKVDVTDECTHTTVDASQTGTFEVVYTYDSGDTLFNAKYDIVVSNPANSLVGLTITTSKGKYSIGETFVKPTIIAKYKQGNAKDVSIDATISIPELTTEGEKTIVASYTEDGITVTCSYVIQVSDRKPISLSVISPVERYSENDAFVKPDVKVTYDDGGVANVKDDCVFTGFDSTTVGTKAITVSYTHKGVTVTASYTIQVVAIPPIFQMIYLANVKSEYNRGEAFVMPTVFAKYDKGPDVDITAKCYTRPATPNTGSIGEQDIEVVYREGDIDASVPYKINVLVDPKVVKRIYANPSFITGTKDDINSKVHIFAEYTSPLYGDEDITTLCQIAPLNVYNVDNAQSAVLYEDKGQTYTALLQYTLIDVIRSITVSTPKVNYFVNDDIEDPVVIGHFDSGDSGNIAAQCTITKPSTSTTGPKTVNISYTFNGETVSTSYNIVVVNVPKVVKRIYANPATIEGNRNNIASKVHIFAEYTSDVYADEDITVGCHLEDFSSYVPNTTMNIIYVADGTTFTTTLKYTLLKTLESIKAYPSKYNYIVGEEFVKPVVKAVYDTGEENVDIANSCIITNPNMSVIGTKNIEVNYTKDGEEYMDSYTINVAAAPVELESLSVNPDNYKCYADELRNGVMFTANYSDGSHVEVTNSVTWVNPVTTVGFKGYCVVEYTEDGKTVSVNVNYEIIPKPLKLEVVNPKTSYNVGDPFVKPTTYVRTDEPGSINVTDDCDFDGYNNGVEGEQTITVRLNHAVYGTMSTSYKVNVVNNPTVTAVNVASDAKTTFVIEDAFDYPSIVVNYSDGTNKTLTYAEANYTVKQFDTSTNGDKTVTLEYEGILTSYSVKVYKKLVSVAINGTPKTSYIVGDTFVRPSIIATFSDGTTQIVQPTDEGYVLMDPVMTIAGTKQVTIMYKHGLHKSVSYNITISNPPTERTDIVWMDAASEYTVLDNGYTMAAPSGDVFEGDLDYPACGYGNHLYAFLPKRMSIDLDWVYDEGPNKSTTRVNWILVDEDFDGYKVYRSEYQTQADDYYTHFGKLF